MSASVTPSLFCAGLLLFAAACSPGDETSAPAPGDGAPASEASSTALAAFGLEEQGRVSWESRTERQGVYTFTGLMVTDEDGTLTAATMTLAQPRLSEEGPVFERMVLEAGEITYPDGVARFDQLLVDQPGPGLADAAAAYFQGREATVEDETLQAERFGELRVTNLDVEGQSEGGGPLRFSLANLQAQDSDGETLGAFELTGLSLETSSPEANERFSMNLDRVEAQTLTLSALDLASPQAVTGALNAGQGYDRFAMTGLAINASGLQIAMPEMRAETERRGEAVVAGMMVMPSLTLSADPEGGDLGAQFATALTQLGYEQFDLSMISNTVYDTANDRVATEGENALRFQDGFEMRFDQSLSGIAAYTAAYAAWFASQPPPDAVAPLDEVLAPLMVERFAIALEDQGLLDRAFAAAAEQQGVEPAMIRMQAAGMIGLMSAFAGDAVSPQILAQAQGALMGFVSAGGTLEIELAPDTPVSAAELIGENGSANLDAAGLTIRHQAPNETAAPE